MLRGELALITGGGGGLGRLLAIRLAKLGVDTIIWDINQEGKISTVPIIFEFEHLKLSQRVENLKWDVKVTFGEDSHSLFFIPETLNSKR